MNITEQQRCEPATVKSALIGIAPDQLFDHVWNTCPYWKEISDLEEIPTAVRVLKSSPSTPDVPQYFRMLLAAHWTTVGSFVPTDVDQTIRVKIWSQTHRLEDWERMGQAILESLEWDDPKLSLRRSYGISGHHGEWFSVVVGAIRTLRRAGSPQAQILESAAEELVQRHIDAWKKAMREAREGNSSVELLNLCTLIAHNFGDLDRVVELWKAKDDPFFEKISDVARDRGPLVLAGGLNQAFMADENHRHFALRKVKALRRHPHLLLPLAPWWENWGRVLVRSGLLTLEEIAETVEALWSGWNFLHEKNELSTVAYPRAFHGILDVFPGGYENLKGYLTAKSAKNIRSGPFWAVVQTDEQAFRNSYHRRSQKWLSH